MFGALHVDGNHHPGPARIALRTRLSSRAALLQHRRGAYRYRRAKSNRRVLPDVTRRETKRSKAGSAPRSPPGHPLLKSQTKPKMACPRPPKRSRASASDSPSWDNQLACFTDLATSRSGEVRMLDVILKRFDQPDETRTFAK